MVPLNGDERFSGLQATVADFWRWAFSDLRDNTTRDVLAELLFVRPLGDQRGVRVAWDNFDALAPDGIPIEVKCSAYLQSWTQKRYSELTFGRLSAHAYDMTPNEYSPEARVRADVFVFAVQTQRDPQAYDMLDVERWWEFWVVSGDVTRERPAGPWASHGCGRTPRVPSPSGELPEAIQRVSQGSPAT